MQKINMNEWKILRSGKLTDFAIIAGITLLFLLVMAMNVNLIFNMTSNQTEEIGQMHLENIRSDFENKIINSENATMQIASEAEILISNNNSQENLTEFFIKKKLEQKKLSNGVCFNVYIANKDWAIIPDFDMPEDYHANERLWFKGAADNPETVYITEPYIDAASGSMCFTMSKMLSDNKTVVALDFNFSDMQESISKMTSSSDRNAIIVTQTGMIIGYKDMSFVGERISKKLPEYEKILERVINRKNNDSFSAEIDGNSQTIFSSETNNGWYMILSADNFALFKDSYRQMLITILVSLLMISVIVIFYLNGVKNRLQTEKALKVKEEFLSKLSQELREPLNRILKLSNIDALETENPTENAAQVRESALKLSDMLDNLFSYSKIISNGNDNNNKVQKRLEISKMSHLARIGIIIVLIIAMTLT